MKAKRVLCMFAAILLVVAMMLMFLTGCNRQVIDTTFSYDNAILALPDGSVVSGKIESWKDYDDGDQIQVKIDGVTYLVHSANIALSYEMEHGDEVWLCTYKLKEIGCDLEAWEKERSDQ